VFVWAFVSSRAKTAATVVALRSQLAHRIDWVQQKKEPKPRFTPAFRVVWVVISRFLDGWEGLPPVSPEMQALVRKLSRENPLWSAERIGDMLLLLGCPPICDDTVRKYMVKPRKPREPSPTWLPFVRSHLDVTWAIDFFTVTAISFATVYVLLVFEHGRRRVLHLATTRSPTMEWVIQQVRNAMPFGEQPRYLFRDNDGIYGHGVALFLRRCGIREVRTAPQSPWQSPYIERFIGTLRRELLNHVTVRSDAHLERTRREFVEECYHVARLHQGLGGETPIPTGSPPAFDSPTDLVAVPIPAGRHHRYVRVDA
jgi:putative transposase